MTLSAAAAYAYVLSPGEPEAKDEAEARERIAAAGDFYGHTPPDRTAAPSSSVATSDASLTTLLWHGKLPVRVTTSEPGEVVVSARVSRGGSAVKLGKTTVDFASPGSRVVELEAGRAAMNAVRSGRPVVLTVLSRATGRSGDVAQAGLRLRFRS